MARRRRLTTQGRSPPLPWQLLGLEQDSVGVMEGLHCCIAGGTERSGGNEFAIFQV